MLITGAVFRSFLGSKLRSLGYFPIKDDPDLWLRPAVKLDGTKYYKYLLAYVYDLCGMSMNTKNMLDAIGKMFTLKKESVKEPDLYLGADVEKLYSSIQKIPGRLGWQCHLLNTLRRLSMKLNAN